LIYIFKEKWQQWAKGKKKRKTNISHHFKSLEIFDTLITLNNLVSNSSTRYNWDL